MRLKPPARCEVMAAMVFSPKVLPEAYLHATAFKGCDERFGSGGLTLGGRVGSLRPEGVDPIHCALFSLQGRQRHVDGSADGGIEVRAHDLPV